MAKFTPLDAIMDSRVVGVQGGSDSWLMPWACPGCKRTGTITVHVAAKARTPDSDVVVMLDTSHYRTSPVCHYKPDRLFMGRLFRRENGGAITYMLSKGQTRETFKPEPWPPWQRQ